MSNLKLWDSLHETDPKYTKEFDRGGFKGTAINPTYVVKRLTEAFGPCGEGWKFVIDAESIIDGPFLGEGEAQEKLHVIRGHIEYRLPTKAEWHSTGQQFGQTKLVMRTKDGRALFDEEAPKKSVTDCMTKCASLLGVAADVHMGLYDSDKYVNTMEEKFGAVKAAPTPAKLPLDKQKALYDAVMDAGLKEQAFFKKYAIKHYENLPESQYDEAMAAIEHYKATKGEKS